MLIFCRIFLVTACRAGASKCQKYYVLVCVWFYVQSHFSGLVIGQGDWGRWEGQHMLHANNTLIVFKRSFVSPFWVSGRKMGKSIASPRSSSLYPMLCQKSFQRPDLFPSTRTEQLGIDILLKTGSKYKGEIIENWSRFQNFQIFQNGDFSQLWCDVTWLILMLIF